MLYIFILFFRCYRLPFYMQENVRDAKLLQLYMILDLFVLAQHLYVKENYAINVVMVTILE